MKKNLIKNTENFVSKKIDWNKIQSEMKTKFGNDIFESWLKKIDFVEEFSNYILISVSTRFIRDWITSRYIDQILQIVKSFNRNISRIEFSINAKKENISKSVSNKIDDNFTNIENVSFIKDSYLQYNRIDPNKNFENFIVGSSNKLAFEASKKVSENIAHYNPLYLYGGVGMGKTHLLNAIGLNYKNEKKVMFISAERFMYQFVKSIKNNDMVKFKEYFRNTDVLLIDDIQFMNGKEALQEEFFHTFSALLDKGSQIVLTADRSPNKLSRIQERIRSRFSGGLVVDIQSPDLSLRSEIIKSKLSELNDLNGNNVKISEEIQNQWKLWFQAYATRLQQDQQSDEARKNAMNATNPKYVLRNYMAQLAIDAAFAQLDVAYGQEASTCELMDKTLAFFRRYPGHVSYTARGGHHNHNGTRHANGTLSISPASLPLPTTVGLAMTFLLSTTGICAVAAIARLSAARAPAARSTASQFSFTPGLS